MRKDDVILKVKKCALNVIITIPHLSFSPLLPFYTVALPSILLASL